MITPPIGCIPVADLGIRDTRVIAAATTATSGNRYPAIILATVDSAVCWRIRDNLFKLFAYVSVCVFLRGQAARNKRRRLRELHIGSRYRTAASAALGVFYYRPSRVLSRVLLSVHWRLGERATATTARR